MKSSRNIKAVSKMTTHTSKKKENHMPYVGMTLIKVMCQLNLN